VYKQIKRNLSTRRRVFSIQKIRRPTKSLRLPKTSTQSQGNAKETTINATKTTHRVRGIKYRKPAIIIPFRQQFNEYVTEANILAQGFTPLPALPLVQETVVDPTRPQVEIPRLAHNLERVITDGGLHLTYQSGDRRNPNIDPFLYHIHQPEEINFNSIPPFITTSRDEVLHSLAQRQGCRYKGSTSSTVGIMCHLYFLLSRFKEVNLASLSSEYQKESRNFTTSSMRPVIIVIRPRDGLYSIDSEPGNRIPQNKILLELGKSLERMMTLSKDEFESRLLLKNQKDNNTVQFPPEGEAYHFSKMGNILFRSQLDCHWYDTSGTAEATKSSNNPTTSVAPAGIRKVFDLKSRAIWKIRIDCANYQNAVTYRPYRVRGLENSFEKEFYDMIRSVFLKYIFQARIGKMDGIFVAYHNTKQLLGFEYVTLKEMEYCIFETRAMASLSFDVVNKLLHILLDTFTYRWPNSSLKLTCQTKKATNGCRMYIFVEPLANDKGWLEHLQCGKPNDSQKQTLQVIENPLDIKNPFFAFTLCLETVVNGKVTKGPFLCQPHQKVKVLYKLEERQEPYEYLLKQYQQMLKDSKLYFIPTEDSVELEDD
jgi:hypothetical protein